MNTLLGDLGRLGVNAEDGGGDLKEAAEVKDDDWGGREESLGGFHLKEEKTRPRISQTCGLLKLEAVEVTGFGLGFVA